MTKHKVTIAIPVHVSVQPPRDAYLLQSHRFGVVWRCLFPILLESPQRVAKQLVQLILLSQSKTKTIKSFKQQQQKQTDDKDDEQMKENCNDPYTIEGGFFQRQLVVSTPSDLMSMILPRPSFVICILPPITTSPDKTFLSVVLKTEHSMLQLQSLSAWLSTLGGGYFFCKRLSVSLQLARRQRALAVRLNDTSMARQCSINEAYNLIYAGKFRHARAVLNELESTLDDKDDTSVTWRQCQAARLFAKRLKNVSKKGVLDRYHPTDKKENHTIDDYQRIRIVEEKDYE